MAMLFLFSLKPFLNLVLMWHCMYSNIAETETYAVRMDSIMMWECDKLLLFNIHLQAWKVETQSQFMPIWKGNAVKVLPNITMVRGCFWEMEQLSLPEKIYSAHKNM